MPSSGESNLVAISLPAPLAAEAVLSSWAAAEVVAPLDPSQSSRRLGAQLRALRPSYLVDANGRHRLARGIPVPDRLGAIVATSGTTARPRLVALSRTGLEASAAAVNEALGVAENADRWLLCLPLHHIAGLAIVIRSAVGRTGLSVHPGFDTAAVSDEAGRCSVVSLVPATLSRLLDAGEAVCRFRYILLGGAPAPGPLMERARNKNATVVTTYGLTETSGGCVHDGLPLPCVTIRLGPGHEILVKGEPVMTCYHRDEASTRDAFDQDGWLHTRDLGLFGKDGRLAVTGRLKDVIITGGTNVSPGAIETVLSDHPGVSDIAVAGIPDSYWGERVVAFVVPATPDHPPALEDLRKFAAAELRPAELPRQVVCVGLIPRSASGKIIRQHLRSLVPPAS